ncbi:MAG: type II toxin-antitoxin system VapC family toxin [Actinobacteria bacterium]|nr:type II toxin-antitoxin system VapC family toxin [Actinomycetota bacterium]
MRLIDTTIAVDYLRGVDTAVDLLERLLGSEEPVVASELVRFELLAGAREPELETLARFFSALAWAPVDEEVSRVSGLLSRRHRRTNTGIDDADYLIAGTAIVLDAKLLTTNVRHFPMLTGLRSPY